MSEEAYRMFLKGVLRNLTKQQLIDLRDIYNMEVRTRNAGLCIEPDPSDPWGMPLQERLIPVPTDCL